MTPETLKLAFRYNPSGKGSLIADFSKPLNNTSWINLSLTGEYTPVPGDSNFMKATVGALLSELHRGQVVSVETCGCRLVVHFSGATKAKKIEQIIVRALKVGDITFQLVQWHEGSPRPELGSNNLNPTGSYQRERRARLRVTRRAGRPPVGAIRNERWKQRI